MLLEHFERTGRAGYKNVGWTWAGGALVLDQPKVRELLGARLGEFQYRTARKRSLKLLD